jgi:hypothetical protein
MPSKGAGLDGGVGAVVQKEGVKGGLVKGGAARGQGTFHQHFRAVPDHRDHLCASESRPAPAGHQAVQGGVQVGRAVDQRPIQVEDGDWLHDPG